MNPLILSAWKRWVFLAGVVVLLLAAASLVYFKVVHVKMLPFDNKSEFQVIVNMPEGTTLEQTARVTREIGEYVATVPEVTDYEMYVGTAAPYNFNGLVRHYFLRRAPYQADLQVNLLPKGDRAAQSHDIAKRVRPAIHAIAARYGARIQVAEVPPGPPVLQTLVAEVYGPDYERQIALAREIKALFAKTPGRRGRGLVHRRTRNHASASWWIRQKAALNGVSADEVAQTLRLAVGGIEVGLAHLPKEKEDVPLFVRLPEAERSGVTRLTDLQVMGRDGRLVPLSEVVRPEAGLQGYDIYHKNMRRVVYVTADVAGARGEPGLRHPEAGPGDRQAEAARGLLDRALFLPAAVPLGQAGHEVGRRVAHHCRGLPRPGPGLCGGPGPDLRPGGGLVPELQDAAHDHGADPAHPGGHPPRPWL